MRALMKALILHKLTDIVSDSFIDNPRIEGFYLYYILHYLHYYYTFWDSTYCIILCYIIAYLLRMQKSFKFSKHIQGLKLVLSLLVTKTILCTSLGLEAYISRKNKDFLTQVKNKSFKFYFYPFGGFRNIIKWVSEVNGESHIK